MAATRETLRLAGEIRIILDAAVDDVTRDLVKAWAEAWQNLAMEWGLAFKPLIKARKDGTTPTPLEVLRSKRAQAALVASRRALEKLSKRAGVRILQEIDVIVEQAAEVQTSLIRSQLPAGDQAADLRASLSRVDQQQLEAIVRRTTEHITSLTGALHELGMRAMNAELVRGVALGTSPRQVARYMVDAADIISELERAFLMPLNRALVIARTEMLDAHREGAWFGQNANRDVLAGWQWLAKLDTRTCPSCWSMHGTMHENWEAGPEDHQQGRCARLPVTKSWEDLGFEGIVEPPSLVPDAQSVFDELSKADQLKIMGPDRLAALASGGMTWSELSVKRSTPGWRDSYGVRPVPRRVRRAAA